MQSMSQMRVTDLICCLSQSQYTDTRPTSPRTDPVTSGTCRVDTRVFISILPARLNRGKHRAILWSTAVKADTTVHSHLCVPVYTYHSPTSATMPLVFDGWNCSRLSPATSNQDRRLQLWCHITVSEYQYSVCCITFLSIVFLYLFLHIYFTHNAQIKTRYHNGTTPNQLSSCVDKIKPTHNCTYICGTHMYINYVYIYIHTCIHIYIQYMNTFIHTCMKWWWW